MSVLFVEIFFFLFWPVCVTYQLMFWSIFFVVWNVWWSKNCSVIVILIKFLSIYSWLSTVNNSCVAQSSNYLFWNPLKKKNYLFWNYDKCIVLLLISLQISKLMKVFIYMHFLFNEFPILLRSMKMNSNQLVSLFCDETAKTYICSNGNYESRLFLNACD